jgi:hypothetical protein
MRLKRKSIPPATHLPIREVGMSGTGSEGDIGVRWIVIEIVPRLVLVVRERVLIH